jgi:uncharacterized SAM-binding protein YcdF (DUF218 family)
MLLSELVVFLISPLSVAILLLFLGFLSLFTHRELLARFLISFTLVWLCFWSLPITNHWFSERVMQAYPYSPPERLPMAQAIVVLGGGIKPANSIYPQPDMNASADRVWFASQLFQAKKAPLILLAGGLTPEGSLYSEAEAMRLLLLALGVPNKAIVLEKNSLNTHQNATLSYPLLHQRGINHILLVTSAMHMQRAEIEFKRQGFQVTPAATDYDIEPMLGLKPYLPNASALHRNNQDLKELVGQLVSANNIPLYLNNFRALVGEVKGKS